MTSSKKLAIDIEPGRWPGLGQKAFGRFQAAGAETGLGWVGAHEGTSAGVTITGLEGKLPRRRVDSFR